MPKRLPLLKDPGGVCVKDAVVLDECTRVQSGTRVHERAHVKPTEFHRNISFTDHTPVPLLLRKPDSWGEEVIHDSLGLEAPW